MPRMRAGLAKILAVGLVMLAGCGGGGATGAGPGAGGAPAPAAGREPVRISFWHGMSYDSAHGQTLKELVQEFNGSQPDVVVEEVYQGSYADLEKKLTAAIAAGTPPTVVQNTDSMLTNLVRARAVQVLDPYVPASDRADYPDALLASATFGGQLYALPFNKSMIVLIYDTTLVRNPPKTWEEFQQLARELTIPGQRYDTAFEANVYYFGTHLAQAGGQWLTRDGKAAFNSEAGVRALQFIVDMAREGSAIQLKPREYQSNYFNEGRAAMIATTSASFAFIKPASGNPWAVAPLYAGPGGEAVPLSGANVSLVSGASPEAAKAGARFLLWLTGREGTLKWAMAKTGYIPVRRSAVADPRWQAFVQANPAYAVLGSAMDKGVIQPNHPRWQAVQKEITTAVEKAVLGQASVREALDEAARKADEILR